MLAVAVPATIAVHTTGHNLDKLSALWEYIGARIALLMPSAVALADWPALPYGQNGRGPANPKLQPVIHLGVGLELLDLMADELFSFHDASPPMLLQGAPLRPMVRASLATLIMYYEQRFKDKEMHLVLTSMREAYTKKVSAVDDAHAALIQWGGEIKRQFDIDNLHLVSRAQHDGTAQVVAAVRGLALTVGRMHAQLSDMGARMVTLETNSNTQRTGVADLIAGVNSLSTGVNSLSIMVRAPAPQMMQREAARPGPPQAPPPPPIAPSLKEHIKSLSIDISPTACAAWRKAGCRKRPAQESAAEESEDAEEERERAVRASPRPLGPPAQEAGSSDESSEGDGCPRPSPMVCDLTGSP